MMQVDDKLLNNPVHITKTDGYNKAGILIQIAPAFVTLKYFDGREVIILLEEIAEIRLYHTNGNGGERR